MSGLFKKTKEKKMMMEKSLDDPFMKNLNIKKKKFMI